ncbi:hypothetical protein PhaeoP72_02625 [Phaeobacter inhibens]|uniref:hypothetical protein n=1 Tax=Phaeobacter inhibens TaxID=221822 RepID=UPI000C9BB192|nr:hypothetical protein [Phaeobacter inhibens]AUR04577.1 hypothetical protein PhaeoP72_02625 [Phaeobacter inhibens]
MEICCSGTARIRHVSSGEIFDIEADELDWDIVGGDERQMGPETHFEAAIEHPDLGMLTWEIGEYPAGVENYRNTNAGGHEIVHDFDYGLEHSEPEPDDWLDYKSPSDPHSIFMDSYHHTGDLLADHGGARGDHLVNRMVFSQQISALEAYLGDTLLNEVMGDKVAMERLLSKDEDLVKEKFTLSEVSKEPKLVERKIQEHLRSINYHNLAKVDALFSIALDVRILNLATDRGRLFNAILLRHDCVHRNGYDTEGKEIRVFTKQFVQETADLIRHFVEEIQRSVQNRAR